jgi:hypothetical protein
VRAFLGRHWKDVYKAVYRTIEEPEQSAEVVQQAFTDFFTHLHQEGWSYYRLTVQPGDFLESKSATAACVRFWVLNAAQHRAMNLLKRKKRFRKRRRTIRRLDREARRRQDPELRRRKRFEIRLLRMAKSRLRPRDRAILFYWSMKIPEKWMAAKIGVAPGSMSTLLRRTQRALRAKYLELEADPEITETLSAQTGYRNIPSHAS